MSNKTCEIRINQHIPNNRLNGRSTGACGKPASHLWVKVGDDNDKSWRIRNTGMTTDGTTRALCKRHAGVVTKSRTSQDFSVWYMIWTLSHGEAVLKAVEPAPVPEKEVKVATVETRVQQEIKSLEAQLAGLKAGNEYKAVVRYGDGEDLVSYEPSWILALNVITGWRDDEVGNDFYEYHKEYLEEWTVDPANNGKSLLDEIFNLVEEDLMDTPMVGGVEIEFIGEGSAHRPGDARDRQ